MPLHTPVLFLIFNRPQKTKQVFEAIKQAQPIRLYVAADGARKDKAGEIDLCNTSREIIKQVDWPCEVKTLFREDNLGCKIAVSKGINWFFENEEAGIILEDDCLPNQSFFTFCQSMLLHYKNDERIMHIGGSNFQNEQIRGDGTYYFSAMNHIWGWATWRRAWSMYDIDMKGLENFINEGFLLNLYNKRSHQQMLKTMFTSVKNNKVNTWDYQWTFACYKNNGLSIVPNKNLVSNIGYDTDATNSINNTKDILLHNKVEEIEEIIHPSFIARNFNADCYSMDKYFIKNKKNAIALNILNRLK